MRISLTQNRVRGFYVNRARVKRSMTRNFRSSICHLAKVAALIAAAICGPAVCADSLRLIPDKITLSGPASHQQLVVERVEDKQLVGQITNAVQFTSSDTNIVRVEDGVVIPIRDGKAIVRAKAGR